MAPEASPSALHARFSERITAGRWTDALAMFADDEATAISADPTETMAAKTTQPTSPYCWVMLNRWLNRCNFCSDILSCLFRIKVVVDRLSRSLKLHW